MQPALSSKSTFYFRLLLVACTTIPCLFGIGAARAQTSQGTCGLNSFILDSESGFTTNHSSGLSKANLETYRLRNARRSLSFQDGAVFTLLSAQELNAAGCTLELDNYVIKKELNKDVTLVFRLLENGLIAVSSEVAANSKTAKIGKGFPSKARTIVKQSDFDQMPKSKQQIILARPHQYKIE